MANLFLGFPVPRAKIADMIASDAPPSLHKTQHQDGGTDEMDVTGLVGAGGLTLPWDDLYFHILFESLTGYNNGLGGTGEIVCDGNGVALNTNLTAGSYAYLEKYLTHPFPTFNWAKTTKIKTRANFYNQTSVTGNYWLTVGGKDTTKHVGFKVVAGVLYGTVANGTTESTLALETLGTGAYLTDRVLQAILTPGANCEFFVNGVSKGTITTNLPTGTDSAPTIMHLYVENPGVAQRKTLNVGVWSFYQEA